MSSAMIRPALRESDMLKLLRLQKEFPKETRRGQGRAGSTFRAKLRKVMRVGGGIENVPKFEAKDPDSLELGELKNDYIRKLGGKLSRSFAVQMFSKTKTGFTVGFLSAMEPYARAFQTSEARPFTKGEKIYLRRAGIDAEVYYRPAREVISPFNKGAKKNLIRWTVRNTEKILEKNSKK